MLFWTGNHNFVRQSFWNGIWLSSFDDVEQKDRSYWKIGTLTHGSWGERNIMLLKHQVWWLTFIRRKTDKKPVFSIFWRHSLTTNSRKLPLQRCSYFRMLKKNVIDRSFLAYNSSLKPYKSILDYNFTFMREMCIMQKWNKRILKWNKKKAKL